MTKGYNDPFKAGLFVKPNGVDPRSPDAMALGWAIPYIIISTGSVTGRIQR